MESDTLSVLLRDEARSFLITLSSKDINLFIPERNHLGEIFVERNSLWTSISELTIGLIQGRSLIFEGSIIETKDLHRAAT
jgi:hypothetical protein